MGLTVQASLEVSRAMAGSRSHRQADLAAPCPLPSILPPLHPAMLKPPGHVTQLVNTLSSPHVRELSEVSGLEAPLEQPGDQTSSTV